jgi:hypothetical protein
MSLEVFKTMDLSAETKNCSLCGVCSEDILCHQITICTELRYQRQDLVNKLFQLLGHSKCTELLQLDEFKSVTSSEAMTLKLLHIQLIFSPLVELFFWTVDYNYKPLLSDFKSPPLYILCNYFLFSSLNLNYHVVHVSSPSGGSKELNWI